MTITCTNNLSSVSLICLIRECNRLKCRKGNPIFFFLIKNGWRDFLVFDYYSKAKEKTQKTDNLCHFNIFFIHSLFKFLDTESNIKSDWKAKLDFTFKIIMKNLYVYCSTDIHSTYHKILKKVYQKSQKKKKYIVLNLLLGLRWSKKTEILKVK